jgi:hypothetical protein
MGEAVPGVDPDKTGALDRIIVEQYMEEERRTILDCLRVAALLGGASFLDGATYDEYRTLDYALGYLDDPQNPLKRARVGHILDSIRQAAMDNPKDAEWRALYHDMLRFMNQLDLL